MPPPWGRSESVDPSKDEIVSLLCPPSTTVGGLHGNRHVTGTKEKRKITITRRVKNHHSFVGGEMTLLVALLVAMIPGRMAGVRCLSLFTGGDPQGDVWIGDIVGIHTIPSFRVNGVVDGRGVAIGLCVVHRWFRTRPFCRQLTTGYLGVWCGHFRSFGRQTTAGCPGVWCAQF
jgi:hypothetical protein